KSLEFEGLDTYASVYLNDSLLVKTANAFRRWSIDVSSVLKNQNALRIVFENPSTYETTEKQQLGYELPEGNRVFTRKAQFQYGWDWGPTLNTMGNWRPVKLIANNDLRITEHSVNMLQLNDSIAKLSLQLELRNNKVSDYSYEMYVNDSLVTTVTDELTYTPMTIPFEINKPKRWWPHNLGEPYLYDLKLKIKEGRTVLDSVQFKFGLRSIELVTDKDTIGETFYFKINGESVYAKGANYIPQHSFQNKVQLSDYETLLNDVVNANMNMLRVWGGGIYENDEFYELCDEKGIMVWQDFMFACAMYPGNKDNLNNVKQEAIDNVKSLRDHPSLVLWCGNNESNEGWHNWGWQADRSEEEKTAIWNDYLKLFDSILPSVVKDYSGNVPYWESSPKYGRGNPKYQYEGDAHDWWVWHDAYPFQHFEDHVPRFMSEFGFQSFPSVEVLKYIQQDDSLDLGSEAIQNHQKHIRGFQLIEEYMARDFPVPKQPEDYVYMSQLLQANGITKGIEAHRRAKPYNMGSLFWQLNDCWPSISWSSIDFFGNWKALHYKAKQSFANVLLSSTIDDRTLKVHLVNDNREPVSGNFSIEFLDFEGDKWFEFNEPISIPSNSNIIIHELQLKDTSFNPKRTVAVMRFNDQQSLKYFTKPKYLELNSAPIEKSISKIDGGFSIELISQTLQKDVFLSCDEQGFFSDNYFDLLPNQSNRIVFKTSASDISNFRIKTFNSFIR
ncbi:MAG: glycoside hydrolase family 2 protein, partial [Bacteroidia bacterium]|nr:glycoside hydrolase family 2 protein [Bacteroidia bacterium]